MTRPSLIGKTCILCGTQITEGQLAARHQGSPVHANCPPKPLERQIKEAFWTALTACDDSRLPYIGTADNGDEELIDGFLPDELWTRMAELLRNAQ